MRAYLAETEAWLNMATNGNSYRPMNARRRAYCWQNSRHPRRIGKLYPAMHHARELVQKLLADWWNW